MAYHAAVIAGATAVAAVGAEAVNAVQSGETPIVVRAAQATLAAARRASNPDLYSNHGDSPTMEQIAAWERKVQRPAAWRDGLRIVRRAQTSPYVAVNGSRDPIAEHDMNLRGFAAVAGDTAGVGLAGGYCLAVLCSVETGAGNPFLGANGRPRGMGVAFWNYNPGNTKYPQRFARETQFVPPLFFLVDRVASLDMYEAHSTLADGIRSWGSRTFLNVRYNERVPGKKTCIEALRSGDLNAFCEAIGRNGYATSYRLSRTALQARAKVLTREAPYNRAMTCQGRTIPAALDRGIIVYT